MLSTWEDDASILQGTNTTRRPCSLYYYLQTKRKTNVLVRNTTPEHKLSCKLRLGGPVGFSEPPPPHKPDGRNGTQDNSSQQQLPLYMCASGKVSSEDVLLAPGVGPRPPAQLCSYYCNLSYSVCVLVPSKALAPLPSEAARSSGIMSQPQLHVSRNCMEKVFFHC